MDPSPQPPLDPPPLERSLGQQSRRTYHPLCCREGRGGGGGGQQLIVQGLDPPVDEMHGPCAPSECTLIV